MSDGTASWAILRQVVLGAEDLEVTSKQLRGALGLAPGFADPALETIGMADETLRVGPQAHLEIVAPLSQDTSLARWIAKGGGGGYALSIQVPDITPLLAAATAAGVRTSADTEVYGHRIVQLHPGDLGLLLELDEIADPEAWFWDDVEAEVSAEPRVRDVLAVDLSSPDPAAQAALWSQVFGVPVGEDESAPSMRLGTRTLRFVPGGRRMLSRVVLARTDAGPAEQLTVGGVRLDLVPAG